jgi:hypothetical protein
VICRYNSQVRADCKSQDCKGARPEHAPNTYCHRRSGDRIGRTLLRRTSAVNGSAKRTCRGRLTRSAPEGKTDVPRKPGHFRSGSISDIGIGLEPSGGRTLQVIGTPAARLKLIAEQFPMVPAAISLHRVGLIRRGCSLRANCFELGLLLVAQRSIEIIKC